ncbi:large conductance mechanosensitive channel protein MscL [soil metagenome]
MIREFKKFITRGNVIDLAVAVIIGAAFGAVVVSFTNDVLMAFVGAIVGEPNFSGLTFDVGDGVVTYGNFLTALVNFLIIAFALFLIIKMLQKAQDLRRTGEVEDESPVPSDEVLLLTEIRDLLTAQRQAAAAPAARRTVTARRTGS